MIRPAHAMCLSFGFSVLTSFAAQSAEVEVTIAEDARGRIEAVLTRSGGTVNYFQGPSGTIGVGVSWPNGKQMVVYATQDGRTMFSGVAVDTATGENITRRDMSSKMPPQDFGGILESVKKTNAISETEDDSTTNVYVFVDTYCTYCHRTYQTIQRLKEEGHALSVHWIPVGVLGPRSENAAQELLGVDDEDALTRLRGFMNKQPRPLDNQAMQKGESRHQRNMAEFRAAGFSGVPALVIQRGKEIVVKNGLPSREDLIGIESARVAGQ